MLQVYVLPGAAFTWGPGWLLNCSKSGNYTTCTRGDGWLLLGMLQHDNYGVRMQWTGCSCRLMVFLRVVADGAYWLPDQLGCRWSPIIGSVID